MSSNVSCSIVSVLLDCHILFYIWKTERSECWGAGCCMTSVSADHSSTFYSFLTLIITNPQTHTTKNTLSSETWLLHINNFSETHTNKQPLNHHENKNSMQDFFSQHLFLLDFDFDFWFGLWTLYLDFGCGLWTHSFELDLDCDNLTKRFSD